MPTKLPIPTIESTPVALLCGGLATRLGDISQTIPKALVEVDGRPFIDHQLALLHHHGIRRAVICAGHMGDAIERHLGDGTQHGIQLTYSFDGPTLLGTGGALRTARWQLGKIFWVMYGDSYMDIDYRTILARFITKDADGLMTVIRNDDRWDRSNAVFEDGRLIRYDKRVRVPTMRYIDYGVQLLRRDVLKNFALGECFDLADLYRDLISQGRMMGHEVFNRFYEIGTPTALAEARQVLTGKTPGRSRVA